MSVNMSFTINAATATELIREIRKLAAILDAAARETGIDSPAPVKAEPVPDPAPAIAEAPETPATPTPTPQASAPPAPAPMANISMEDVRAKLASLVQADKQEQVKELLASFGATKLSEVPAERYGELMQKASEIA